MIVANHEFSVGALHGWKGVFLGLGASTVFALNGVQDFSYRFVFPSAVSFFLAVASAGAVIWLGVGAGMLGAVLLGVLFLCSEFWLMRYWWRRRAPQNKFD